MGNRARAGEKSSPYATYGRTPPSITARAKFLADYDEWSEDYDEWRAGREKRSPQAPSPSGGRRELAVPSSVSPLPSLPLPPRLPTPPRNTRGEFDEKAFDQWKVGSYDQWAAAYELWKAERERVSKERDAWRADHLKSFKETVKRAKAEARGARALCGLRPWVVRDAGWCT
jgi:hypothetical protein